MNNFSRYVFWQLLVGMIFVTTGLTCVIWLTQSLRFIEMIINRGISAGLFLYLTMLQLPSFLSVILPFALFIAIAFVYVKMISDRELVVMRAAGLNQISLAKPALVLTLVVMVISYALNMFLIPKSYKLFRELQWDIRYNYSHVLLREGAFNSLNKNTTVYIRERTNDGELLGIMVHDARNEKKPVTLMAERGAMVEADNKARVVMFNGNRQEIDKSTQQMSVLYFDRYVFDLDTSKSQVGNRHREAREREIGELFNAPNDSSISKRDVGKFVVEAHKRILSPFYALAFALLTLACLITGSITRRSQSRRIVLAVGMIIFIQMFMLGLENVSARNLALVPSMYFFTSVVIVTAFTAMVRVQGQYWRSFASIFRSKAV